MIKGQLNKAIKSTKAFHEYQETKKKMSKEEILDKKLKENGIRKGWIKESKQAVLDAMEEYAEHKLNQNKDE